MGRGDKRTERGKRARGSFGNARNKSQLKARARTAAAKPKAEAAAAPAPAEKPKETPAAEKAQAEESA